MAAIYCSPESWDKGTLFIECDGTRINYKLKNEGSEDKATLSDELRHLCERYWVAFRDNGEAWLESEITFQKENDEWSFGVNHKFP